MTPAPRAIGPGQSLKTAREMMQSIGARHLPVQDGGRLIGILTDRDIHITRALEKSALEEILVEDVYTPDPYIVDIETPLHEVAKAMSQQAIGCALIAEGDTLVGIFTTVDACRVLSEILIKH